MPWGVMEIRRNNRLNRYSMFSFREPLGTFLIATLKDEHFGKHKGIYLEETIKE
jgi:hypothetical protein